MIELPVVLLLLSASPAPVPMRLSSSGTSMMVLPIRWMVQHHSHAYSTMGVYLPKMILEDPQGCRVPIPGKDTIRIYDVDAAFGNNLQLLCDSGRVMFNDQTVSE